MSGTGIIKISFVLVCAVLLGLLFIGAWALRNLLPASHPLQSKLSGANVLRAAKFLAALLIAGYFLALSSCMASRSTAPLPLRLTTSRADCLRPPLTSFVVALMRPLVAVTGPAISSS